MLPPIPRLALLALVSASLALATTAHGQARLPGEADSTRTSPAPADSTPPARTDVRPDPTPPPSPARADTTLPLFPYGRALTYRDILRETRLLRRRPEPPPDTTRGIDPMLGIIGLVVDETLTPTGRLFYERFFLRWTPPPGAERVSLTIGEQPLPGNGTAVVIRADGETIVQARLPRRLEEVEGLADQAIAFVRRRVAGG